jgi:uncharacterized protein
MLLPRTDATTMIWRKTAVRKAFALGCYLAVGIAVGHWSHSTSGFLTSALGLSLLLDRFAFTLLPWPPLRLGKEIAIRAAYFLAGASAFYLMRPGVVALGEAAYRGTIVCLVGLMADAFVWCAARLHSPMWWTLTLRSFTVAVVVFLVPLLAALHPLHTVPKRDPATLGFAFENVRFSSLDRTELAGWLIPHPDPRGNVIFCHGHGRNRGHCAGLLQTFHDLRLNVLAFDFRGHGASAGDTSTFGHREVQDLLAAAAYMDQRCPGQPLFLVGVSLGAAVSLQALPDLANVRGVWSEGSFARFGHAVDHKFAWLPAPVRGSVVELYYVLGWLDCGLWGPSLNPVERLRTVTVPVCFCHATRDDLVPLAEGQALYQTYEGRKEHWWVEGATHYNVRQQNRPEYLSRLARFLEACLSDSGNGIGTNYQPRSSLRGQSRGLKGNGEAQPRSKASLPSPSSRLLASSRSFKLGLPSCLTRRSISEVGPPWRGSSRTRGTRG